jgi:hypothetical protein
MYGARPRPSRENWAVNESFTVRHRFSPFRQFAPQRCAYPRDHVGAYNQAFCCADHLGHLHAT